MKAKKHVDWSPPGRSAVIRNRCRLFWSCAGGIATSRFRKAAKHRADGKLDLPGSGP